MPDLCGAETRLTLSHFDRDHPSVVCTREVDGDGRHIGDHQGIDHVPFKAGDPTSDYDFMREDRPACDRLLTWDAGGAMSCTYDPEVPNTNCMCRRDEAHARRVLGHGPEDHRWATCTDCGVITDATRPDPVRCSACGIWWKRIGEPYLRPREGMSADRIYSFSPTNPGGFGGMVVTIVMDDGTVVADGRPGLWDGGQVPWWLDDLFPPNCTITTGRRVPVAGHTDRAGRPLTYTGHPEVRGI